MIMTILCWGVQSSRRVRVLAEWFEGSEYAAVSPFEISCSDGRNGKMDVAYNMCG
jgi:hypothetical protein